MNDNKSKRSNNIMNTAKGNSKDRSYMDRTNGAGNGMQNGEELPEDDDDQDMEYMNMEMEDTQLLGAAAPDGDGDADESSGSSAADMSGGTNRSSGGYSGDYSSISDESSDRAAKNHGHHRGSHHAEHVMARDGGGGGDISAMTMCGGEMSGCCDPGFDASHPSRGDMDVMMDGGAPLDLDHSELMHGHAAATGRRHAAYHQHQSASNEQHIHSFHRHNHTHNHQARGSAKAKPTKEVNRQIDQIMNLYNVSLQAAAEQAIDGKLRVIETNQGDAASVQPEAKLRIRDPSDPRIGIDVQQLYRAATAIGSSTLNVAAADASTNQQDYNKVVGTSVSNFLEAPSESQQAQAREVECSAYANLMDACRPFFHDSHALMTSEKPPLLPTNNNNTLQAEGSQTSSGFTSFFTTTKSESNRTNSGSGGSFSEPHQAPIVHQASGSTLIQDQVSYLPVDEAAAESKLPNEADAERNQAHSSNDVNNASDHSYSSLVVLARVKRKHKDPSRQSVGGTTLSNSDNTNDSRKRSSEDTLAGVGFTSKRVRIDTVALDGARHRRSTQAGGEPSEQHQQAQGGGGGIQSSSSLTSSLTQSLDSSGSDSGGQQQSQPQTKTPEEEGGSNVEGGSSNTDSTTQNRPSTETSNQAKPRVITDISSGTNGSTTANGGSSGSGTGSGNDFNTTSENGNTTSNKSESGSGSGTGGNSNSDEQKGVSGEPDSTGTGSDGCGGGGSSRATARNEDAKPESSQPNAISGGLAHAKTDKPLIHHHHHHSGHHHEKGLEANNLKAPPEMSNAADSELAGAMAPNVLYQEDYGGAAMMMASSKERIVEKKRKRMNMRREYEEDMALGDSLESPSSIVVAHDNDTTSALEPGKPVILEDVLSFTKTARLLVQALPPFLAVHVNAAFTSLCGIQSSAAIGTPVASVISLPDLDPNKENDSSSDNNKDGMSSLSGSAGGNSEQNNSNMANANAAAIQQRDEEAPGGPGNNHTQIGVGLRIDRLIVARGYGHIHDVDVLSVPHHSHSHAIEGSEVKFIEGNGPAKRRKKDDSILCRMSVSPVMSTTPVDHWHHHSHVDSNRRKTRPTPYELSNVKHYLIQLEAVDGPRLLLSRSPSSSTDTTMEARLLGITKTEVHSRRCRLERHHVQQNPNNNDRQANHAETEESQDDGASAIQPVATCG